MRRAARVALAVAVALTAAAGLAAGAAPPPPLGIVAVEITVQEFDPAAPWNKKPEKVVRGNALVVEGRWLLTTSDLVKDATLIEVRKFGRYPDFPAQAVLVDYEVDLALLTVASEEFWQDLQPLPFAKEPVASGRFEINRWRNNGRFEQGSGEVVELQVATSRYGTLEFPELRGTTAMTGLGWGEVLTSNGEVIGLITSHNQNALHAINSPLLELFIAAARQRPYRGFAHRGFAWQQLNHAALRRYFSLEPTSPGVLVRKPYSGGTGSNELRKGDILLRLGPHVIDPEGQINHPLYGPILFTIAMNETLDEEIPALIRRDGVRTEVSLRRTLFDEDDFRIHPYRFDEPIEFEMFGGLVLQELSLGYLRLWGNNWRHEAPTRLVLEFFLNSIRQPGDPPEKVVFVSKVLPDTANLGYGDASNSILLIANGRPVRSLREFREAVATPMGEFHVLDMNPADSRGRLVFNAATIEEANARVRSRYGVPDPRGRAATAAAR